MERFKHIWMVVFIIFATCFQINAQSIDLLEDVEINGLKQKILIRSNDTTQPILLFLHGGPGMTSMLSTHYYSDSLMNNFIFVDWDQRGAGYSYNDSINKKTMVIDQFVDDVTSLTYYLMKRFDQKKIFLVGHSWGSIIGLKAIHEYPEFYYSFTGMGQAVNLYQSEQLAFNWLHGELIKAKDTAGIRIIEETMFADRGLLTKYGGVYRTNVDVNAILASSKYFSPEYMDLYQKGFNFSIECLFHSQVLKVDFFNSIDTVEVPVNFIHGKYDRIFDESLIIRYNNRLTAPAKKIIWFENSGHFPHLDQPQYFQKVMINIKEKAIRKRKPM